MFLNTDYDAYVLNDINPDLIDLYNHLKRQPDRFIGEARRLFVAEHNHKTAYYRLRTQFNQAEAGFRAGPAVPLPQPPRASTACAAITRRAGSTSPSVPTKTLLPGEGSCGPSPRRRRRPPSSARELCRCHGAREEDWVIYRSPLCAPLHHGEFHHLLGGRFHPDDQALLARLARHTAAHKGVPVLISNHDIELTWELYRGARLDEILVKRTISRNGGGRKLGWPSCWHSIRPASNPSRVIILARPELAVAG